VCLHIQHPVTLLLNNTIPCSLTVSKPEFADFVERQRASLLRLERPDLAGLIVEEDNETMENSYLIMDHNLCFLNCRGHAKVPTKPIPEIGLTVADIVLPSSHLCSLCNVPLHAALFAASVSGFSDLTLSAFAPRLSPRGMPGCT